MAVALDFYFYISILHFVDPCGSISFLPILVLTDGSSIKKRNIE